jgi:tripartite-type tricarboxylate transporter receptor subunit TctC
MWTPARSARWRSTPSSGSTLYRVPTFAEAGLPLPEMDFGSWLGFLAPKGTPAEIVSRLNAVFKEVLRKSEVVAELKVLGLMPHPMSVEEFAAFLHDDMKKWPESMAATGLKPG